MTTDDARDAAAKGFSLAVAVVLNVALGAAMAYASFADKPVEEAQVQMEWIEATPIPRLGEEKPKEALPRIIQAPEPEPAPSEAVKLAQEREEELERERVQKKLADDRQRQRDEELKKEEEDQKKRDDEERKKRNDAMRKALARVERDVRADEDSPAGLKDGHEAGTSDKAAEMREAALYAAMVALAIRQELRVPATISDDECKRLAAQLSVRINEEGKVVGQPAMRQSSGNQFFDDAALSALRRFGPDSNLRIPLPRPDLKELRNLVLKRGLNPLRVNCKGK